MMNLESCSPVQQLSELLAAQTTPPPVPEALPHIREGHQLARVLDTETPCDPACPGPIWSLSTPLPAEEPAGRGRCSRLLLQRAWCQHWFLFLFVSSS